jgi:hypothetical protein
MGRCARSLESSVFALNKEGYVAIARIVETRITPEEYEQMRERLGMGDAVGCTNSVSCREAVFVDQSAQAISTHDVA